MLVDDGEGAFGWGEGVSAAVAAAVAEHGGAAADVGGAGLRA